MEMEKDKSKVKKKKKQQQLDETAMSSSIESINDIDLSELQKLVEAEKEVITNQTEDNTIVIVESENENAVNVIANEQSEHVQVDEQSEQVQVDEQSEQVQVDEQEEKTEEIKTIPSAPISQCSTKIAHTSSTITSNNYLYPNLSNLKDSSSTENNESQAQIITTVMKPFELQVIEEFYVNEELEQLELFEREFIHNELKDSEDHFLYVLLKKYANTRTELLCNMREIDSSNKKLDSNYKNIWRIEKKQISKHGFCTCGRVVRASVNYDFAHFCDGTFAELEQNLKNLQHFICLNHIKLSHQCALYQRQIDQIIAELINCKQFSHVTKDSLISLIDVKDSEFKIKIIELRMYISVMFRFLREISSDDVIEKNVHNWIRQLVSLQLRVATWQDHIFILFHILRCKDGVGNWAANFIQIPSNDSFKSFQHCVAILSTLLMPVANRIKFLEENLKDVIPSVDNKDDKDLWILVESDGEDSSSDDYSTLKENDLVAIFDQVPLNMIFKTMTFIDSDNDSYRLDLEKISSGHNIIKTIGFSSKLILTILKRGLMNMTERHKQFAKRLAKLIKYTLFYIRDLIQIYEISEMYKDPDEFQRIHVEYDELLIRSVCIIYENKKFSLFQFLADLPYDKVSSVKSLWRLWYCLHLGEFQSINNEVSYMSLNDEFFEKFNHFEIPMDDLIFLLHAFANMAMAKGKEDWQFALFIIRDLIDVGFINEATRDICYNTVKNLIYDITSKYSDILSDHIFDIVKQNLHRIGVYNLHLLKSLPLDKWKPKQKDFEIFESWLLNFEFDSIENFTARFIIKSLNWDFDPENAKELFLPAELHLEMAYLICDVYIKYVNETEQESKIFGNFTSKKPQKRDNLANWCWSVVSILKLHRLDINKSDFLRDSNMINFVPELEQLGIIYQGCVENKPLPIFVSLLTSRLGHSIPHICHHGFNHLNFLLSQHRYVKVIKCLELITPLFVNCQDSLFASDSFMNIMEVLIKETNEERIKNDSIQIDPKVKYFGLNLLASMIQNQLSSYQKYGWTSPYEIITLWTNCLTKMKNWNKDEGIAQILEILCQSAYPYVNCWQSIREILKPFTADIPSTKIPKSSGWLGLIKSEEEDILLSPFSETPTLSLLILECELETTEMNTGLWNELVYQLAAQSKKSFNDVYKSVLQSKGVANFPAKSLVIYKLARLICNCSMKSFVFPIVCQQFFNLYLSRAFVDVSVDLPGIQKLIYEQDTGLMKKLKEKFQAAESYHNEMIKNHPNDDKFQFHMNCEKIFKTFSLWLDESQLTRLMQQNHVILPPQYESAKLTQILQGNWAHWTEYINLIDLKNMQRNCCDTWMKVSMKSSMTSHQISLQSDESDSEDIESIRKRIYDRLKSTEKAIKPPPEFIRKPLIMGKIDLSKNTLQLFKSELKLIKNYARQYAMIVNEHKAVDATYLDCIKYAYKNEPNFKMKTVTCSSRLDSCQHITSLRLEYSEMKSNEIVRTKLEDNRDYKKKINSRELKEFNPKISNSHFCLETITRQLVEFCNKSDKLEVALEISSKILMELLNEMNEEIRECPISYDVYSCSIAKLGSFLQKYKSTEGINFLKLVLKNPTSINVFAELFTPSSSSPRTFISLYECLVDFYAKNYESQLVFLLLSKFDMPTWLETQKPKLIEVSELIKLIFRGLELYSLENSELLQDILKCHLIHLFFYRFPEHFGEILHIILQEFSNQRLRSCVLLDILNACYQHIGCKKIEFDMPIDKLKEQMRMFASKQNLLSFNDLHSTTLMFSHHFYNERLSHGLHGIYPKYSIYCDVLAIIFGTIGHSVISAAIKEFPEITADQLVNELFSYISNMYAPMLTPIFYAKNMTDAKPANWIQQLTLTNSNGQVLQPWSNLHMENAEKFIKTFAMCLTYIFDMLPASNNLIGNLFCWYIDNFAHTSTPNYVLLPVQKLLIKMPFERLLPVRVHMEGFSRVLAAYLPDCHTFLGNIFLRISWSQWLSLQMENHTDIHTMQKLMSIYLMTLVKLTFEPFVRESIRILQLLQDSIKYPWMILDYKDIENVLDWFVMSTEPSIILNIPSEHESIDINLLLLLQTVSCMRLSPKDAENYPKSELTAKRMIYVRSVVRLLKSCDAKLHQLIHSKKGQQMFIDAFSSLLDLISSCVHNQIEATNLIVTITENVLSQSTSESTLGLFVKSIQAWQEKARSDGGDLVACSFLDALKIQNYWTLQVFQVLESTLYCYFKKSDSSSNWIEVCDKIGSQVQIDNQQLIDNELYLSLHLLSYKKISTMNNDNDRVEFLQELQTKLALKKTTEATESSHCMLWAFIITSFSHILKRSGETRKCLENTVKILQNSMSQSESWTEGILSVVGLKRDNESNDKKILLRSFSIAIQALLENEDYEKSLSDLNSLLDQKKFADIKVKGLRAISIIESNKSLEDFNDTIAKIIRTFYSDRFLVSIENLYSY